MTRPDLHQLDRTSFVLAHSFDCLVDDEQELTAPDNFDLKRAGLASGWVG